MFCWLWPQLLAGSWWKVSVPYCVNLSIELLKSYQNLTTGFPQKNHFNTKSEALVTMPFKT